MRERVLRRRRRAEDQEIAPPTPINVRPPEGRTHEAKVRDHEHALRVTRRAIRGRAAASCPAERASSRSSPRPRFIEGGITGNYNFSEDGDVVPYMKGGLGLVAYVHAKLDDVRGGIGPTFGFGPRASGINVK